MLGNGKDGESNVFPRVAREGRKFKVGLCAVTQQPKLLDDELLSQFNTFFILGLADEKDRNILRGSAKQDISALGTEIQTLMPGECLMANLAAPFAVPARVHLYADVVAAAEPPPAPRPQPAPNVSALVDWHAGRGDRRRPPGPVVLPVHDARAASTSASSTSRCRSSAAVDLALAQSPDAGRLAGRHLRPPPAHVPLVPRRAARAGQDPRPRHRRGRHQRQPRHAAARPAPAAPTRRWPTCSPSSTSRTASRYERFELPGLVVHAVPQMLTVEATLEALAEVDASRSARPHQPAAHPSARAAGRAPVRRHQRDRGRRRTARAPTSCCSATTTRTARCATASGTPAPPTRSPSPTIPTPKGIVVLDTDTGDVHATSRSTEQRPMVTPEPIHALGLGPDRGAGRAGRAASPTAPAGAVVRVYVDGVAPEAWRLVDHEAVREARRPPAARRSSSADAPAAGARRRRRRLRQLGRPAGPGGCPTRT